MSGAAAPPYPRPRAAGDTATLERLPDPVREGREIQVLDGVDGVDTEERPTVLLLSSDLLRGKESAGFLARLPAHVTLVAIDRASRDAAAAADRLFLTLTPEMKSPAVSDALDGAIRHFRVLLASGRTGDELRRLHDEIRELNRIGMALMSERNPDELLDLILGQAGRMSTSDAGSLYLVVEEDEEDGQQRLHFLRAQNDPLQELPDPDFTLPLDRRTSVAGYVALTGEPLVLDDWYEIEKDAPCTFNRSFDEEHGYRAKFMLVVPMKDHRDRVVGVLQLINRKEDADARIRGEEDAEDHVVAYTRQDVELVRSLGEQTTVSIENGQLYQSIEKLFEGFIKAAVTAIDQRDPATSGHSVRVTELTCALAEVVARQEEGRFADVSFSTEEMKELRYAGLLHDFGKVGVREEVLVKRKKLPPAMWARLESRFRRIRNVYRARFKKERAAYLEEKRRDGYQEWLAGRVGRLKEELTRVQEFWDAVSRANEPLPLPEEGPEVLHEIHDASVRALDGEEIPFLTDEELHYLAIQQGTLDQQEVEHIRSHVMHGCDFLKEIPWTDTLSRVGEIMLGHHEKLDGTRYPRGVSGEEIPIKTRMMAVADIFDALTAADRPYKSAIRFERALEILRMEADDGALDPDLVELFIESEVYERIRGVDWREL